MVYVPAHKRKANSRVRLWRKGHNVCGVLLVYCHASLEQTSRIKGFMNFDTDSFPIGVDNCATYCISDNQNDFVGPLQHSNTLVSGIGGHQKGKWTGTVRWPVVNDTGQRHELLIPNTVLLPKGSLPFRLLSPQHFGQENFKCGIDTTARGTMNFTSGIDNVLTWADCTYRITTQLTKGSNIALINSDAGYKKFSAFVDLVEQADEPADLFSSHLIPDDESIPPDNDDRSISFQPSDSRNEGGTEGAPPTSTTNTLPHVIDFLDGEQDFCMPLTEETEDDESRLDNPTHELLMYHYRLAHEPFTNLQQMAKDGILPKRLANCRVPQCAACHYGKASKIPWRVKGDPKDGQIFQATMAGQVVSVDQLKSTVPGLVGQIKGWPTTMRYHIATVFVDHFSRFSFIHLQKSDTAAETLMAKHAFEGYARTMGIKIQHYHADNGRFCENVFMNDVKEQGQHITFCGNAHFQSGIAERRIRELQDGARTSMIHAKHRWGPAIDVQLWPYALRHQNDVFNSTQKNRSQLSPLEIFSNSQVRPKLKHFHPFGCPAYRVNNEIQAGNNHPKWLPRAKPVVYLGSSPRHARSVSLVLDLQTAHVSPQFHLKYDNLFETVSASRVNPQAQISKWQEMCGFRGNKPIAPLAKDMVVPESIATAQTGPPVPDNIPEDNAQDFPLNAPDDISLFGGHEGDPPNIEDGGVGPFGNPVGAPPLINVRRSSRNRTPTQRFIESLQQREEGLVAFVAAHKAIDPILYKEDRDLQQFELDPIAFALKATSNPDTMYYH
jgi:hypothetical protein